MRITRRSLIKGAIAGGAIGTGITFEATKEDEQLDFDISPDKVSGSYTARGQVLNLVYDGEDQLEKEPGNYEVDMNESLFDIEVANAYAEVDIDRDGQWRLSVGLESGEGYKDIEECEQTDEEAYAETVESYGAQVENGTIDVKDNKSSSENADSIADMLEEDTNKENC